MALMASWAWVVLLVLLGVPSRSVAMGQCDQACTDLAIITQASYTALQASSCELLCGDIVVDLPGVTSVSLPDIDGSLTVTISDFNFELLIDHITSNMTVEVTLFTSAILNVKTVGTTPLRDCTSSALREVSLPSLVLPDICAWCTYTL